MMQRLLEGRGHYYEEAEDGKIPLDMVKSVLSYKIEGNSNSDSESKNEEIVKSHSRLYDAVFMDFLCLI